MAGKPPWALAGTMPGDHGLDKVRKAIADDPRERRFAIIEYCARDTKIHRPEDGNDETTEIITILSLEPVTEVAEVDQVRAIAAKCRAQRPGQARIGDEPGDPGEHDSASAAS
jgi:hypothetical protein